MLISRFQYFLSHEINDPPHNHIGVNVNMSSKAVCTPCDNLSAITCPTS